MRGFACPGFGMYEYAMLWYGIAGLCPARPSDIQLNTSKACFRFAGAHTTSKQPHQAEHTAWVSPKGNPIIHTTAMRHKRKLHLTLRIMGEARPQDKDQILWKYVDSILIA